jgi:hypothetical protein
LPLPLPCCQGHSIAIALPGLSLLTDSYRTVIDDASAAVLPSLFLLLPC